MIKVGLLGAGMMGNTHIGGVRANGAKNVKYVGVFDIDAEKRKAFADKYGIKSYKSFDDMISDHDVDMVDLSLPSHLHEDFCIKIVEAGKHVFVEKPIAFELKAAHRMLDAANRNGVRLMVGQVIRFWPQYAKIKQLYDEGALGELKGVYCARLGQMPTWGEWYKDPNKSGETLMNLTLHDIDFLHYLIGKPKSVYSAGLKDDMNNYNDVMNIFTFENGANAIVDGSLSMTPGYPFTMHFRGSGTKATVEFLYKAGENIGAGAVTSFKLYVEGEEAQDIEFDEYDGYGKEVEYFAQCIEDGSETDWVTNESVLTVLASVVAAKESLADNKVKEL